MKLTSSKHIHDHSISSFVIHLKSNEIIHSKQQFEQWLDDLLWANMYQQQEQQQEEQQEQKKKSRKKKKKKNENISFKSGFIFS